MKKAKQNALQKKGWQVGSVKEFLKLSTHEASVLEKRSAFALYKNKGLDAVVKLYPNSVKFVQENMHQSLKQITAILSQELK